MYSGHRRRAISEFDVGNGIIITSSITNEVIDELALAVGDDATAVIKASDVMSRNSRHVIHIRGLILSRLARSYSQARSSHLRAAITSLRPSAANAGSSR